MKKPRILFLVQLPPPIHGSSLVNQTIVESEEVQNSFDVDVIETQLAKNIDTMGSFSFSKVINGFKMFFLLLKKLIISNYDLAYLTLSPKGFAFYKDALLAMALKLFKVSIVYHLHGKGIAEESKTLWKKKLYKWVFSNEKVIVLDELLYYDIEKVYPYNPYVLNNGIQKVNLPKATKSQTTFIYLSNLIKQKGILDFMEAIKLLQNKNIKNFRVIIIGANKDVSSDELKSFVNENNLKNIDVLGAVYGEKKYEHLVNSDIFVLPTYFFNECYPLSILEACQAKLAVISTKVGAIPSMIKNEENGCLVQSNKPDELAEKMKYLIDNPDLLDKIKQNNQDKFNANWTQEIFIKNFIQIMNKIV